MQFYVCCKFIVKNDAENKTISFVTTRDCKNKDFFVGQMLWKESTYF